MHLNRCELGWIPSVFKVIIWYQKHCLRRVYLWWLFLLLLFCFSYFYLFYSPNSGVAAVGVLTVMIRTRAAVGPQTRRPPVGSRWLPLAPVGSRWLPLARDPLHYHRLNMQTCCLGSRAGVIVAGHVATPRACIVATPHILGFRDKPPPPKHRSTHRQTKWAVSKTLNTESGHSKIAVYIVIIIAI